MVMVMISASASDGDGDGDGDDDAKRSEDLTAATISSEESCESGCVTGVLWVEATQSRKM